MIDISPMMNWLQDKIMELRGVHMISDNVAPGDYFDIFESLRETGSDRADTDNTASDPSRRALRLMIRYGDEIFFDNDVIVSGDEPTALDVLTTTAEDFPDLPLFIEGNLLSAVGEYETCYEDGIIHLWELTVNGVYNAEPSKTPVKDGDVVVFEYAAYDIDTFLSK